MHLWRRAAFLSLGPDGVGELRSGEFYWSSFTPKRVRHTVALHRPRFLSDLPVEEGKESSMKRFIPCEAPAEKRRSRTRKDKHIAVDEDTADGECFPEDILGDYLNRGEPIDHGELLGSDVPAAEGGSNKGPEFTKASRMVNGGLLVMNQTLDASNQEACLPRFRAEMADKEIACLRYELKRSRCCEGELTAKEIRRAYRRGKKEMVEVMKTHRAQFLCEFGEVKESYQALADYRECRGSVGGLYFTQIPDYSFAAEDAKQTRRMKWEPIPVSPDTVEGETRAADETGEVNQPTVPLNIDDYSMGGSMTRYYKEKDPSCHLVPCPLLWIVLFVARSRCLRNSQSFESA
ncbi:hypothetical protein DY000_02052823 [Brassica cretica]|uniref:Uncharacterized protein n=1 Tax=Brassica cretica TaxID=69181 RepID=A0ABQ7A7L1_BRACR|nr:hypothetical protein DY000_02052823 [Brassica cretica]